MLLNIVSRYYVEYPASLSLFKYNIIMCICFAFSFSYFYSPFTESRPA